MPFVQELKTSKSAQEGPVPEKSFFGALDSSVSLKVLKGVPTLKAAFTAGMQAVNPQPSQKKLKPKSHGKVCTGYFGCKNIAVSQEACGTLFCREHKPKQVPTTLIQSDKSSLKNS